MSKCQDVICSTCGDSLIHQTKRNKDESSSAYGQHIHDDYPNEFYWADADGMIFKRASQILRIIEHKFPGKDLSSGQQTILPLLSIAIELLIQKEIVNPESGVFLVKADSPWKEADVCKINAIHGKYASGKLKSDSIILSGERLRYFETGLPLKKGK